MSVQDDSVTDPWQAPGGPQPYAPPPAPYGDPYAYGQQPYGAPPAPYRDPFGYGPSAQQQLQSVKGLGTAVVVLSALYTALLVLEALLAPGARSAADLLVAQGAPASTAVSGLDVVVLVTAPVLLALWIVASIWLQTARANAYAMRPGAVRRHPAWAWLGWLVPIAALFVPKQLVDDVRSVGGAGARPIPSGSWWAGWMTLNVLIGLDNALSRGGVHPTLSGLIAVVALATVWPWIRVVRDVGLHSRP